MVHLTFLQKNFVFQSKISTYSLIIRLFYFQKTEILLGQGVVQFKPKSAWSIACVPRFKNKKNFCYSLPRKNVCFTYGNLRISRITNFKIGLFHQVKELFEVNQIHIPDYQYYLSFNAKKMVRLNFLEKKVSFSYGNLRISRITNFKNRSFLSDQGVVQSEPN